MGSAPYALAGYKIESGFDSRIKHFLVVKLRSPPNGECALPLTIDERQLLLLAHNAIEERIREAGFSTRLETDFYKVRDEIEHAGKEVSPHFWPMFFDYNLDNGFCMILDSDGEGVAYICYQRIDLGGMNLWEKHVQRCKQCFGRHPEAKFDDSWVCQPMTEIRGVGAYSGDALTRKNWRAKGAKEYLELISYLSQFLAAMHWPEIQWIGGLATNQHVRRGLGTFYGARNMDPCAERWITPPLKPNGEPARRSDDWFLSTRRADILYRAKCVARGHLLQPSSS
jgi:hypothetical protein